MAATTRSDPGSPSTRQSSAEASRTTTESLTLRLFSSLLDQLGREGPTGLEVAGNNVLRVQHRSPHGPNMQAVFINLQEHIVAHSDIERFAHFLRDDDASSCADPGTASQLSHGCLDEF
jgi:hypothetical protein